jgi:hypothetical protein
MTSDERKDAEKKEHERQASMRRPKTVMNLGI